MDTNTQGFTEEESKIAAQWSEGLVGDEALNTPALRLALLNEGSDLGDGFEEELGEDKQELGQEPESVNKSESDEEANNHPIDKKATKEKKPIKQELFETKNELNTLKQRHEAKLKKLRDPKYLEEFIKENKINVEELYKPISKENLYADETIENIIDANNETNRRLAVRDKAEEIARSQADAEIEMFSEIYELQNEYEHLRTDLDISEINNIIVKNGGSNVPKQKLIDAGLSEGDFEKFNKIVAANRFKSTNGYKKLRTAYLDNGGVDEIVKSKQNLNIGEEFNKRQKEALKKIPRVNGGFTNESEVETRGQISESFIRNLIKKEERVTWDGLNKDEAAILTKYLDGQT